MSTDSSPLSGPPMLAILRGAVDAIRTSPVILGLFLVLGILRFVLPFLIEIVVAFLVVSVGVVIANQALGEGIRTDSPFILRLFMALLATFASYFLLGVAIFALALPGVLGWIGFLVLVLLWMYVYVRLFLSTPLAMVEGHGPAEALSASWRLMNGSVLATAFALVLVFLLWIVVFAPVLWFIRSNLILVISGTLIVGTFLAAMQAFLYLQLAETP